MGRSPLRTFTGLLPSLLVDVGGKVSSDGSTGRTLPSVEPPEVGPVVDLHGSLGSVPVYLVFWTGRLGTGVV